MKTRIKLNATDYSFSGSVEGKKVQATISSTGFAFVTEAALVSAGKRESEITGPNHQWWLGPNDFKRVIKL